MIFRCEFGELPANRWDVWQLFPTAEGTWHVVSEQRQDRLSVQIKWKQETRNAHMRLTKTATLAVDGLHVDYHITFVRPTLLRHAPVDP